MTDEQRDQIYAAARHFDGWKQRRADAILALLKERDELLHAVQRTGRTMSCICGGEVEKLRRENERLEAELALRTMPIDFLVEVPVEHRKHGQGTAFHCGVETAWRGRHRSNPYEFHTPQYRAWETGFRLGAQRFADTYAATIDAARKGGA